MKIARGIIGSITISIVMTGSALAQSADAPYGTAKFAPYADIDSIKQLKVVWDFNFVDPKVSTFSDPEGVGDANERIT